jgi:hypothetical protein
MIETVRTREELLWRRKDGVQWNPADDACVATEVMIAPGTVTHRGRTRARSSKLSPGFGRGTTR